MIIIDVEIVGLDLIGVNMELLASFVERINSLIGAAHEASHWEVLHRAVELNLCDIN